MTTPRLVFLVSQPRSGSTLLQHLIAQHANVETIPEPWLMLPLLTALRGEGYIAPYQATYAAVAFSEFLQNSHGGVEGYYRAVGDLGRRLYAARVGDARPQVILDKTPRYYHVLPELACAFPEARFVLLKRNPLAVLTSIAETNGLGSFRIFARVDRWHDAVTAPRALRRAARAMGERAITVQYEQLVDAPESELRRVVDHIGLPWQEGLTRYDSSRFQGSRFVDPKSIHRHDRPVSHYAEVWRSTLRSPYRRPFLHAYLRELGPELVEWLGYDFDELSEATAGGFTPLRPAARAFWSSGPALSGRILWRHAIAGLSSDGPAVVLSVVRAAIKGARRD